MRTCLGSAPKPVKPVRVCPLIPMGSNFKDVISCNEGSEIFSSGVINRVPNMHRSRCGSYCKTKDRM